MVKKYSFKKNKLEELKEFFSDERTGPFFALLFVFLSFLNIFFVKNQMVQIPLGLVSVLVSPGYLWLDVLSNKAKFFDFWERLILSISVSIGLVVTLGVIFSFILGFKINQENSIILITIVSLLGFLVRLIKK